MIKSKPEIRGELKNSHKELHASKRRWEHWLSFWWKEKGLPAPLPSAMYPVVSCQSNDCSFWGLKDNSKKLWAHTGFRELLASPAPRNYPAWQVTCKANSAMNWSAFPDWSRPPAERHCGARTLTCSASIVSPEKTTLLGCTQGERREDEFFVSKNSSSEG